VVRINNRYLNQICSTGDPCAGKRRLAIKAERRVGNDVRRETIRSQNPKVRHNSWARGV
jgi:hypothetical protein